MSKKGLISNLKTIDKKNRIVLLGTTVVLAGVSYVLLSGDDSANLPVAPSGKADIAKVVPKIDNKIKIGEPKLDIPEESKIAKAIEEGRTQEIEDVRESKKAVSYIDQLKLDNDSRLKEKIDSAKTIKTEKKISTGIDSIMKRKKDLAAAKKAAEEEAKKQIEIVNLEKTKKKEPEVKKEEPKKEKPVEKKEVVTRAMLMNAFLEKEIADSKYIEDSINRSFARVAEASAGVGNSTYISATSEQEGGNAVERAGEAVGLGGAVGGTGVETVEATSSKETTSDKNEYDIVPGEQMYAIVLNSINSDEPGPILAQIVDGGKLEGAKLIGSFETNEESVTLSFNTLTMDGTVYDVGAVAVDLTDDGITLADDVDNHIIERYGSLALASFLDGYAQSLNSSTSITTADGTTTTTTTAIPNADDQLKAAIGAVGTNFVPILQDNFNKPATITVNGGRAIGIMFLKPFDLID